MEKVQLENLIRGFLNAEGKLTSYPTKRKKKNAALLWLSFCFEEGKIYTEKEVNEILNNACAFKDPALLRRELYNLRFLERTRDCSEYHKSSPLPTDEELGIL